MANASETDVRCVLRAKIQEWRDEATGALEKWPRGAILPSQKLRQCADSLEAVLPLLKTGKSEDRGENMRAFIEKAWCSGVAEAEYELHREPDDPAGESAHHDPSSLAGTWWLRGYDYRKSQTVLPLLDTPPEQPSRDWYIKRNEWLNGENERLQAEVLALREQQGWQPIETAPKDQRLLLYVPDEAGTDWANQIGYLNQDEPNSPYWVFNDQSLRYAMAHQPTHWMPLPTPPDPAAITRLTGRE